MSYLNKIIILLILCCACYGLKDFKIPDVDFEALKSGGFRAYILAFSGITKFEISAYVNGQIFKGTTYTSNNHCFVITFNGNLKVGDTILYNVTIEHNDLNYSRSDRTWEAKDLLDSYTGLNDFIPDVKFEALKSGGFRAYIPAISGITEFRISANVNGETLEGRTDTLKNYYFIIEFMRNVTVGDFISYKVYIKHTGVDYSKSGLIWNVMELLAAYTSLGEYRDLRDFIPDVKFEALKFGGFRAYIPAVCGIARFEVNGLINNEQPFKGQSNTVRNNYFVINFTNNLKIEDFVVYYKAIVKNVIISDRIEDEGIWVVTDLLDSFTGLNDFMPDVRFEGLKSGGFRAYIPALEDITEFSMVGNISGTVIDGKANRANNYYFIIDFNNNLIVGDLISYKMFITHKGLPYSKAGMAWRVTELLDSYTPLGGHGSSQDSVPDVRFEALGSGGFRAYVPAIPGLTKFEIDGYINEEPFSGSTNVANNSHLIINFHETLRMEDFITYRKKFVKGFVKPHVVEEEGIWIVTDLLDSYSTLAPCNKSETHSSTTDMKCIGEMIMADDFDGPLIDNSKWIVEHRIPTYFTKHDFFEFNSYENRKETCFIRNGVLYLKPVARTESEINGILNLTAGCTSDAPKQCYHKRNRQYIVPPVKSGRITSKFSFRYGKIEIKAKLPIGDWIAPVIHLQLGPDHSNDNKSPKILIGFSRGNLHLVCGSMEEDMGAYGLYGGVLRKSTGEDYYPLLKKRFNNAPYHKYFHVYTLEWTPGKMSFYVDSNLYGDITGDEYSEFMDDVQGSDSSQKEFVISLGVAVGGIFDFPDTCNSGNTLKPWSNPDTSNVKSFFEARHDWLRTWNGDDTALQIDYVRVWAI